MLAFDKYRGTATARELTDAGARAAKESGWAAVRVPLADGGEGSLEVLGGPNRVTRVSDPLGRPVDASWRREGATAYIEMAAASGLGLAGGPVANDPLAASTRGTGQLIRAALDEGADRVVVFLGGSATTDGGLGAVEELADHPRLHQTELVAAADVRTTFVEAAEMFGPQKGATPEVVARLHGRLVRVARRYAEEFGVDVIHLPGGGAAGGLAGGLAAVGGRIVSGFELLAGAAGLGSALRSADAAVTGEGRLDAGSFAGKVVGGVCDAAVRADVPVLVVVGNCAEEVAVPAGVTVTVLTEQYGREEAWTRPITLVEEVVGEYLAGRGTPRRPAG